jgi:hypothetical protein
MRIVQKGEFSGTRQELEAAVASYAQALADHATTFGQSAPWPAYPVLRELVQLAPSRWALAAEIPEVGGNPPAEIGYRQMRAVAYRDRLGKESGNFIVTLGDVLDAVIREMRARGEPATDEFATVCAEIDAIKVEHPEQEDEGP